MNLETMSAHADYEELLQWLSGFRRGHHVMWFMTYGEPSAADALRRKIGERFWLELLGAGVPATRSFSTEPVNWSRQSAKKPARTPFCLSVR